MSRLFARRMRGAVGVWILALLAAGFLLIVATYRDYGVTWDESVHAEYGDLVVEYFASGFTDTRCNELLNLKYYAPLADLVSSIAVRWTGGDAFEVRHFVLALTALGAVVGVAIYANAVAGAYAAVAASLALATLPRFFGNAFNNPKDIPFACAFTWAMLALSRLLAAASPRRRDVVMTGVAMGLALGIRPGAFPLLAALLAGGIAWRSPIDRHAGSRRGASPTLGSTLVEGILVVAIAWVVMVAPWPWAHEGLIRNPIAAMREAADFTSVFEVRFDGATYRSDRLPWSYLPKYLLVTTPLAVLALAAVGVLVAPRRRGDADRGGSARSPLWLVRAWLVAPVVAVVALRPNLYDSYRHFLFLLPALAILVGFGAKVVVDLARDPRAGRLARAALIALLLLPIVPLYRLHPYGMTYFNAFVGGLAGADGDYDTEYWASSYKEAIEWVRGEATASGRPVRVLVAANRFNRRCAEAYASEQVKMKTIWGEVLPGAKLPKRYDYYVSTTRYGYDKNFSEVPIVHVVGREGVAFTVIRSNRVRR